VWRQNGLVRCRADAEEAGILASILSHFGALSGQKWLKKGQNRGFTVTIQLTMYFCIVFIMCNLRDFYR
jgi:hypothetical protein